ncbi:MAG TPA: hypothetical protein VMM35_03575 [Longimicrobiales bacterium]|nr:hypothetical protein [Longimicrobiales bacterium]
MEERAGGREPPLDRVTQRRPGLGSRPVVRAAFGASVALHVLAILAYPALSRRLDPEGAAFPYSAGAGSPAGIEVIEVVEVDVVEELERPEDPEEIERIATAPVEIERPTLGERGDIDLPAPGLTPAERLRPRLSDRRIWAPLPPEWSELTLEQREELLIAGRLQEWQDSVSAATAAAAAWTDWTFQDGDGGRWGVSQQGLHLGDLTLPLPQFEAPYGQREYMWQWNEIARQGARAAVQETVRDRMEAIRARRDAERARERSSAPADSTNN